MNKKDTYEAVAEKIGEKVVSAMDVELWDVEFVKEAGEFYLRYYIDKDGGVTIEDCEKVSRAISDLLDREDPIEEAYILEVSSPGIFRTLKKDKDFEKNIGEWVLLKFFAAYEGQKELRCILKGFNAEAFEVEADGQIKQIPRDKVAKASLDPEL